MKRADNSIHYSKNMSSAIPNHSTGCPPPIHILVWTTSSCLTKINPGTAATGKVTPVGQTVRNPIPEANSEMFQPVNC